MTKRDFFLNEAEIHKQPTPLTNKLLLVLVLIGLILPTLLVCLLGLGGALSSLLREGSVHTFSTLETTLTVLALCSAYAHYSLWRLASRVLTPRAIQTPVHVWVGFVLGLIVASHLLVSVLTGGEAIRSWDIQSIVLSLWFQGGGYWMAALSLAPTALRLDRWQSKSRTIMSPTKP